MYDRFDDNTQQSDLDYAHEKECFEYDNHRESERLRHLEKLCERHGLCSVCLEAIIRGRCGCVT